MISERNQGSTPSCSQAESVEEKEEQKKEGLHRMWDLSHNVTCSPFVEDYPTNNAMYSSRGVVFKGINEQLNDWIEGLKTSSINEELPLFISEWEKGPTWFDALMRLHFANCPVDNFTHEDLGIVGEGEYDQHMVYRAVLDKLKVCHGIKNFDDFKDLMNWLIRLDFVKELPSERVIKQVPGWLKSMKAELVHLAAPFDANKREFFDPAIKDNPGVEESLVYSARYARLKCQLLQTLLTHAPQEWSRRIINSWLHDQNQSDARDVIFKQDAYPLNTDFEHHTLWVVLLNNIVKQLPERRSNSLADGFRLAPCLEESNLESAGDIQQKVKEVLGRTIVFLPDLGFNRYLKIQAENESDQEFRLTTARVHWLGNLAQDVCHLQSDRVKIHRIVRIINSEALMNVFLSGENKETVLKLTGGGHRLAADFSLPESVHYEKYIYDLASDEEKIRALDRYLYDYAQLWKNGISGPGCINAFHEVELSRPHMTFPGFELPHRPFQGSLERWNGEATDYPNIGEPGMRDLWGAHLWEEKSFDCMDHTTLKQEEAGLMQRKLGVLNLADAALGAVLVYGRCFNKSFDFRNQACLQKVKADITGRMVVFFCQAFPVSEDLCRNLMQEHGLADQVVREICYWMAHPESQYFYVQDLREGRINHDVYPNLPLEMQGCILSDSNKAFLTDIGFHDPQRDRPGECQLGSGSGRTPLIALNAMLAKLITAGICAEISERQRADQESKAELQRSHTVIV